MNSTDTKLRELNNWRPDWQDQSSYPSNGESLKSEQWAWEFLRRNHEYQKDYKGYKEEGACYFGDTTADKNGWPVVRVDDTDVFVDTGFMVERKYGLKLFGSLPIAVLLGEKQHDGLYRMPDPTISGYYPGLIPAACFYHDPFEDGDSIGKNSAKVYPKYINNEYKITFDLSGPLDTQLALAKLDLIEARKFHDISVPRYHKEKFSIYLRILDAIYSGATAMQIASVIYKGHREYSDGTGPERKVVTNQKTANWLVEEGYRSLAISGYLQAALDNFKRNLAAIKVQ